MPLVDCPDPACRHRYEVAKAQLWHRTTCPSCGAQGAAIPNRWPSHGPETPWSGTFDVAGISLVLEDLRSAYNVGSILRSCDAFGAAPVLLAGVTAPADNPKVVKTALGAHRSVSTLHVRSAVEVVRTAAARGYTVAALETTARSVKLGSRALQPPLVLVVGNEVAGVSSPVLDAAHVHLDIPMRGIKTSLNAAVACGIALYVLSRTVS